MLRRDAPNAWPPHQYIALEALRALPSNITSDPLPTPNSSQSTFDLIPSGQIGVSEDALPVQAIAVGKNASLTGPSADINKLDGTVTNGGNKTDGEGWAATLQRELTRILTAMDQNAGPSPLMSEWYILFPSRVMIVRRCRRSGSLFVFADRTLFFCIGAQVASFYSPRRA